MRGFKPMTGMTKPVASTKIGAAKLATKQDAQTRAGHAPKPIKSLADPKLTAKPPQPAPPAKSPHADKPISWPQTAAHGKNKTSPIDQSY